MRYYTKYPLCFMKFNILFCFLLFGLFTYTGCGDDDDDPTDELGRDELRYDGPNFTAPLLPQNTYVYAAFFPESEVAEFAGRTLEEISFYLEEIPERVVIRVYEAGGTDNEPGREIYNVDVTARVDNDTGFFGDFYDHIIPGGILLDGTGLWLGVEVQTPGGLQIVGCDAGDNYNPNGDRLQLANGNTWTSFREFTGSEEINWNIRGFLAEE